MKYTRDKYFLLENDIVVLRNGDRGLVTKDGIVLQNGKYFLRYIYKKKNKFSQYVNEETKYDIVKIYHDNKNKGIACFNLADNDNLLVWAEKEKPFPELENGDVIILNNGDVYMKVDHILVNQIDGYINVNDYDNNGKLIKKYSGDDDDWDIKKVYRDKDKMFYSFNIKHLKETLIWERC